MKTSVYGWGVNDVDHWTYKDGSIWPPYLTWREMVGRCHSPRIQRRNPTYRGCEICSEWQYFSNFLKWYNANYIVGYQLDKDLLVKGNKIYSPETCCFIPQEINKIFTKTNSKRGVLPIGVKAMGKRYQARLLRYDKSIHIGTYDTPEEAFQAYKQAKESYIKEVAIAYYKAGKFGKRVYEALMKYEVEITD